MHAHHGGAETLHVVQEDASATSPHHAGADGASFDDHFSCAGCCCAGMIATATFDWKPQAFLTPAMPSFIAATVPGTVPQRLERPPRMVFA